jgi:hypothetical protein
MRRGLTVLAVLLACPAGLVLLAGARGAELTDSQQRSLIGYVTCLKCVTTEGGAQCQPDYVDINAKDPNGQVVYTCDALNVNGTQTICTDDAQAKNCTANTTPGACRGNTHFCRGFQVFTCCAVTDEYGVVSYQWEWTLDDGTGACGSSTVPSCQ